MLVTEIFPQRFVPNIEAGTYHGKWVRANPNEAARWAAFRDACIQGRLVDSPAMTTHHGKALVAAGEEHMSITRVVGSVVPAYPPAPVSGQPPPPPPPPPPSQDRLFQRKSDFEGGFNWFSPPDFYAWNASGTPWPNGSGVFEIATPGGNGMRVVCHQEAAPTWEPTSKMVQMNLQDEAETATPWIGQTQRWTWQIRFPSALNDSYNFGVWGQHVLMQWGTAGGQVTVGHEFVCNPNQTLSFLVRQQPGTFPLVKFPEPSSAPQFAEDTWIPIIWEVKHSFGSDGYMKGWINGVQVMDWTGPNMYLNEYVRHMGIGWYSDNEPPGSGKNCVEYDSMGYEVL